MQITIQYTPTQTQSLNYILESNTQSSSNSPVHYLCTASRVIMPYSPTSTPIKLLVQESASANLPYCNINPDISLPSPLSLTQTHLVTIEVKSPNINSAPSPGIHLISSKPTLSGISSTQSFHQKVAQLRSTQIPWLTSMPYLRAEYA
jgi:hypothetical protein